MPMPSTLVTLFSKMLHFSVSDGPFLRKWRFFSSGFFLVKAQIILSFLFMISLLTFSSTLGWLFKTKFQLILMVYMSLKFDNFVTFGDLRKWQNSPKTVFIFSRLKSCHYLWTKIYILERPGISWCGIFFFQSFSHKSWF